MDALSSIFSNIGGFLTNSPAGASGLGAWSGGMDWGNLAKTLGVAGLGDQFVNNWMAQRAQNQYINSILGFQKNPQVMANQITSLTQPLNQNLVASVSNQVQGQLANQGLAESPAIQASVLAQALAPYQQQNQQLATQEWYNLHNLPIQFPQQANMTGLWRFLLGGNQQPGQVPGGIPMNIPGDSTVPNLLNLWNMPPSDPTLGGGDLFNFGLTPSAASG
jgi:hypothetical protein